VVFDEAAVVSFPNPSNSVIITITDGSVPEPIRWRCSGRVRWGWSVCLGDDAWPGSDNIFDRYWASSVGKGTAKHCIDGKSRYGRTSLHLTA
jgi:hypothetical protein